MFYKKVHFLESSQQNACPMPATSVMGKLELDYYHQNVNGRVASQAAEQVKTSDIRKLGNFKKKPAIQKLRKNCCKAF